MHADQYQYFGFVYNVLKWQQPNIPAVCILDVKQKTIAFVTLIMINLDLILFSEDYVQCYFTFDCFIQFPYLKTTVRYLNNLISFIYLFVSLLHCIYLCCCLWCDYLFLIFFICIWQSFFPYLIVSKALFPSDNFLNSWARSRIKVSLADLHYNTAVSSNSRLVETSAFNSPGPVQMSTIEN